MLSREDNELVTRVGPGTPMGELMRQYWLPVLHSWELDPDGRPLRVRLLGEDLIAWRDTNGRPALIREPAADVLGRADVREAESGVGLRLGRRRRVDEQTVQ